VVSNTNMHSKIIIGKNVSLSADEALDLDMTYHRLAADLFYKITVGSCVGVPIRRIIFYYGFYHDFSS